MDEVDYVSSSRGQVLTAPDEAPAGLTPDFGHELATRRLSLSLAAPGPYAVKVDIATTTLAIALGPRHLHTAYASDRMAEQTLAAGSVVISPRGAERRSRSGALSPEFLAVGVVDDLVEEAMASLAPRRRPALVPAAVTHPDNLALARGVRTYLLAPDGRGALYAETLLFGLLQNVVASLGPARSESRRQSLDTAQVRKVGNFVEEHLDEPLSLECLAAHVGIGPFAFPRAFREATGMSPHAFVTERRLNRACNLLRNTREPLAEIAYAAGFSSQSHMTTVFGKKLGVTPGRYRQDAG